MSIANDSLKLTGLYEAELLVELMLRFWHHPYCDDREFRNTLLETAAEVLRAAITGTQLIESLPPESMNLVAAIWYAEWNSLQIDPEPEEAIREQRQAWVTFVRRSIPSCFCDPDVLN